MLALLAVYFVQGKQCRYDCLLKYFLNNFLLLAVRSQRLEFFYFQATFYNLICQF